MNGRGVRGLSLWAISVLIAFGACRQPPPAIEPMPPAVEVSTGPFKPPPGFTKLRISTTPYFDQGTLQRFYQGVADYLGARLHVPVEVVIASSYGDVGRRMRDGEVDLGSFSPLSYVRAREADPGLQPVVNFISEGSATSAGYIVVRADGPYKTLEDLRQKRFAFVDPSSTTGFLYPTALLRAKGYDPRSFFGQTQYVGNHAAALMAVFEGQADGAAIYQGALPALQRSKGIDPLAFRIIAKTHRTPKDLFCARAGLPAEVVDEIRRSLLSLSVRTPEGRRVLSASDVNGFIPADEHLYDGVREVEAELRDAGL